MKYINTRNIFFLLMVLTFITSIMLLFFAIAYNSAGLTSAENQNTANHFAVSIKQIKLTEF